MNQWKLPSLTVMAGFLLVVAANFANADEASPAGVARLSDFSNKGQVNQTAASLPATQAGLSEWAPSCAPKAGCATAGSSCCQQKSSACGACNNGCKVSRKRCAAPSGACHGTGCSSCKGHCGHGYLFSQNPFGHGHCHQGCCGKGCPPWKHYFLTYAADPDYFDQRDGKVFAAQGYGIPMAVPLAPNVEHTYNYGWGIPSSRLTPVSRISPRLRTLR